MRLDRRYVEKPWGRASLPPQFDPPPGARVGELWLAGAADLPLLVKYIFTSERLSIQVHPNDAQARRRGLPHGKGECWYVIDAEPGAVLGLGPTRAVEAEELRLAALDGSIEQLIGWRPVGAGDFVLVPPGTIHAIGAGITLLEIQQNLDVTYRLYDYGRPRELHLEDAIDVAVRTPFDSRLVQHLPAGEERTLVDGTPFTLVSASADPMPDRLRWLVPLSGQLKTASDLVTAGGCLLAAPGERVSCEGAWLLAASA
jgi:mannose-6-phosphate isomerase